MKDKLTASERRGIILVAGMAMVITGAGLLMEHCSGNRGVAVTPPEVELLLMPDAADPVRGDSTSSPARKRRGKRKQDKDSVNSKKGKPARKYPRRSHLDESNDN